MYEEFVRDRITQLRLQKALEGLKQLNEDDLQLILNFIDRLRGGERPAAG